MNTLGRIEKELPKILISLFDSKVNVVMVDYFRYGEEELVYLKRRDKRLAEVIDKVGLVKRRVIPDLFAALVHSIVGQQISTKADETIWARIQSGLGTITPEGSSGCPMKSCSVLAYRSERLLISRVPL